MTRTSDQVTAFRQRILATTIQASVSRYLDSDGSSSLDHEVLTQWSSLLKEALQADESMAGSAVSQTNVPPPPASLGLFMNLMKALPVVMTEEVTVEAALKDLIRTTNQLVAEQQVNPDQLHRLSLFAATFARNFESLFSIERPIRPRTAMSWSRTAFQAST